MLFSLLDQYSDDFEPVSADELIDIAKRVAADLQLPPAVAEVNERLLRHYVSEGVVKRPDRVGREARYGSRHLLDLLVTRLWLTRSYPLAGLRPFTVDQTKEDLITLLKSYSNSEKPVSAEALVSVFRRSLSEHPGTPREARRIYSASGDAAMRKPPLMSDTSLGMVDVLHEMRSIEDRLQRQLKELDQRFHDVMHINAQTRDLLSRVEDQQRLLITTAEQQKFFVRDMFRDLHSAQQAEMQQLLKHLFDNHAVEIHTLLRDVQIKNTNPAPDSNPAP
jgi:DNA-binding transcriptional MerR regulator